jgi:hypothetical protein
MRQLTRFTSPADIEGTGFLAIETAVGETDQFLYLPALRRTRRIVSSQKSSSFVNSDFTYEDLERRDVDDAEHVITGEDKIGKVACYVMESRPKKGTDSQYAMWRSKVAKGIYIPLYTEYYNKREKLFKTYKVTRLKKIQGIWTLNEVIMEDLRKKHKTILKINKVIYNQGLDDGIFTRKYLESWK